MKTPAQQRSTHAYQKQRARFKAECKAKHLPCWIDGEPIDYDAPRFTSQSFEVDHAIPLSIRPDLAQDPANWRPSHCSCNRSRQAKQSVPIPPSGRWVPASW